MVLPLQQQQQQQQIHSCVGFEVNLRIQVKKTIFMCVQSRLIEYIRREMMTESTLAWNQFQESLLRG